MNLPVALMLVLSSSQQPEPGPAAWWRLDEGFGAIAEDASGHGHTGQLEGAPDHTASVPLKMADDGGSLDFDGVRDYVYVQESGFFPIADSFTMAFWALPRATRRVTDESSEFTSSGCLGERFAICPFDGADFFGSLLKESGAGVSVGTNGIAVTECYDYSYPTPLVYEATLGGWIHVAVVYRDKRPSLYVNGEFVREGQTSGAWKVHPSPHLGGGPNDGNTMWAHYGGGLDDVRIYDRALDPADIAALARIQPPSVSGLVQRNPAVGASLPVGGRSDRTRVELRAALGGDVDRWIRLEVELREAGAAFRQEATHESLKFEKGSVASVAVSGLAMGTAYHWQARAVYDSGFACAWTPFSPWAVDFQTAANLSPMAGDPAQRGAGSGLLIGVGERGVIDSVGVQFEADVEDPDGDAVCLEFEARPLGDALRGEATGRSAWVDGRGRAGASLPVEPGRPIRWQYRAVDLYGAAGAWAAFGGNPVDEADFSMRSFGSEGNTRCVQSAAGSMRTALVVALGIPLLVLRRRGLPLAIVLAATGVASAAQSAPGQWSATPEASIPLKIDAGGNAVGDGNGSIFVIEGGGTTTFKRFTASTGAWASRAPVPKPVSGATAFAAMPGTTHLYLQRFTSAGSPTEFYRYDTATDAWSTLAPFPGTLGTAGALAASATRVFSLTGSGFFSRFTPPESGGGPAGRWDVLTGPVPANPWDGDRPAMICPAPYDAVYALAGHGTAEFWRGTLEGGPWKRLADLPDLARSPSLCLGPDAGIYAQRGNSSRDIHRYDRGTGAWTFMDRFPSPPSGAGGGLAGGLVYPGTGDSLLAVNRDRMWTYSVSRGGFPSRPAALPASLNDGGSLAASGTSVYLLWGDSRTAFSRYSIETDAWSGLAPVPRGVVASALVSTGPDTLHAFVFTSDDNGRLLYQFLRYSISGDAWTALASSPGKGDYGRLAWDGGDGIYGIFVDAWFTMTLASSDLYRYSISANTWTKVSTVAPSLYWGSAAIASPPGSGKVYALQGNGMSYLSEDWVRGFQVFDVATAAWSPLAELPADSCDGAALAMADEGRRLFAFIGGRTFAAFDLAAGRWDLLAPAPVEYGTAGALSYPGSGPCLYAAPGSGSSSFWRYQYASGPAPSAPIGLSQARADGSAIPPGGACDAASFSAGAAGIGSVGGFPTRLEIELRPNGVPFADVPTAASGQVIAGSPVAFRVIVPRDIRGLHWQARSIDFLDTASAWVDGGDFSVPRSAPTLLWSGQFRPADEVAVPEDQRYETGTALLVMARASDAEGDAAGMEVESSPAGVPFTGEAARIISCAPAAPGGTLKVVIPLASDRTIRWRLRLVDPLDGPGGWVAQGGVNNPPVSHPPEPLIPALTGSSSASSCGGSASTGGLALPAILLGLAFLSRHSAPVR